MTIEYRLLLPLLAPRHHIRPLPTQESLTQIPHHPSNIRTQKIILHTRLHLPHRRLQELSPFQPHPYLNHGEIAFAGTLEQRCASALGAELAEDGEGTERGGEWLVNVRLEEGKGERLKE